MQVNMQDILNLCMQDIMPSNTVHFKVTKVIQVMKVMNALMVIQTMKVLKVQLIYASQFLITFVIIRFDFNNTYTIKVIIVPLEFLHSRRFGLVLVFIRGYKIQFYLTQ